MPQASPMSLAMPSRLVAEHACVVSAAQAASPSLAPDSYGGAARAVRQNLVRVAGRTKTTAVCRDGALVEKRSLARPSQVHSCSFAPARYMAPGTLRHSFWLAVGRRVWSRPEIHRCPAVPELAVTRTEAPRPGLVPTVSTRPVLNAYSGAPAWAAAPLGRTAAACTATAESSPVSSITAVATTGTSSRQRIKSDSR